MVALNEVHAVEQSFNRESARLLRDLASLLRLQGGNPFRINAYVRAASTLEGLSRDARAILHEEGLDGLIALPTIGRGIALSIEEIARTGRLSQLERLRGAMSPELLFRTIPGIGAVLSRRIYDELHVESLEGLEMAAHDGRLESLRGVGPRRAETIRAGIARLLKRAARPRDREGSLPPVALLLDVDAEYRERAKRNSLPKIAPKRFNPEGDAWLPVLHTVREPWHFTVLYSNTARAHELKRTHDWVVVYYYDDDHREGQCTIVTESRADLDGLRVVRGREDECRSHHQTAGAVRRRG